MTSLLGDALRARASGGAWHGVVAEGGVEATFELLPGAPETQVRSVIGTLRCPDLRIHVSVVGGAQIEVGSVPGASSDVQAVMAS